jgi:hypothetical protein
MSEQDKLGYAHGERVAHAEGMTVYTQDARWQHAAVVLAIATATC